MDSLPMAVSRGQKSWTGQNWWHYSQNDSSKKLLISSKVMRTYPLYEYGPLPLQFAFPGQSERTISKSDPKSSHSSCFNSAMSSRYSFVRSSLTLEPTLFLSSELLTPSENTYSNITVFTTLHHLTIIYPHFRNVHIPAECLIKSILLSVVN